MTCRFAATCASIVLLVAPAAPATAHARRDPPDPSRLVRRAIALLVDAPDDVLPIERAIDMALDAPAATGDRPGVDLDLVAEARRVLLTGDRRHALALLEVSIGARPYLSDHELLPVGKTSGPSLDPPSDVRLLAGDVTGSGVLVDPLRPRRRFDGGTWLALGVAALVALSGLAAVQRRRGAREEQG